MEVPSADLKATPQPAVPIEVSHSKEVGPAAQKVAVTRFGVIRWSQLLTV